MVVLAASICTRSGKPLLSRQFRPIPRSRVDGLLASFPKLIPANSQHTTVETNDVRFVYQPFEELYVLLITNKGSNILQDINTLQLIVRLISSLTPAMSEAAILHHSFDLLCAFDEVVSLGYKEQVTLSQVRSVLEGESHEEKIQEIIARNKEAEAKEELKRRAKQLEMQRREQQRLAQASRHGGGGGHGLGGMAGGYSPVSSTPRFETPQHEYRTPSPAPAAAASKPAFRGSGMKLGSKKGKANDLISQLGHEAELEPEPEPIPEPEPEPEPVVAVSADVLPEVDKEEIHVLIKEQLDVTLLRDGGLKEFELKGELQLQHTNADLAKVKLELAAEDLSEVQFKQHPSLAKFAGSGTKVVALKDASRSFPANVSVLRWRLVSKDESKVPLTVTVWPQPRGDGTSDVAIEYELEASHLTLRNVVISIPIPHDAFPVVTGEGDWQAERGFFTWTIPEVDANEPSGSLEFRSEGDADTFFPVNVGFAAAGSLANVGIVAAKGAVDGSEIVFSQEQVLTVDKYEIV
ncbi:Coatomer subunit delta [Vanrija pseudolonga]|uniref:Coatomer subunit delta n=1 Tax=Vanrija pseudolonga TaxID=143232 RepID=A0AAF0Y0N6_9TREE|nr:Coatomer subunit delta [Vanrija pseudolonga]